MMTKRLFVGIPIPSSTMDALLDIDVAQPGFRLVAQANLHLTLQFIGEVDTQKAADIEAVLGEIQQRPFLLPVEGIGFFPPRGKPSVFWVGVGNGHPLLFRLQKRVEAQLERVGIEREKRPYHPHITLARLRNVGSERVKQLRRQHADFTAPPMRISSFNLYLSQLKPSGVVYSVEKEFFLSD